MTSGPVRVSVFGKTDLGLAREHNEDAFLVADLSARNASLQPEIRDHVVGPKGSLFLVADGMGGAAAGELASQMAADLIYTHLSTVWATDDETSDERFAYRMREAVELANHRIHEYAREHPELRGMGTTATVAGVYGAALWLAQIGDSRAYLARGGEVIQLTKDQSLMQRLVDAGEMTQEEAEQSERRNIILQALGPDPRVKVDLTHQALERGDTLIICSDGLSGQVRREEIGELIAEYSEPAELCTALINLANSRGGPDNITVVVARLEGDGLPESGGAGDVGYQRYRLPETAAPTGERVVVRKTLELASPSAPGAEPAPPLTAPAPPAAPADEAAVPVAPPRLRRPGSMLVAVALILLAMLLVYAATR
ncbi:MAG TPA: Stp1/IreP family PP2C-type Ser/Thr phosphatase [Gemmatimonadales bacterium]